MDFKASSFRLRFALVSNHLHERSQKGLMSEKFHVPHFSLKLSPESQKLSMLYVFTAD